jgi:hypothetical protein
MARLVISVPLSLTITAGPRQAIRASNSRASLRIPMKSAGDSDRIQPPVPIEGSRGFR